MKLVGKPTSSLTNMVELDRMCCTKINIMKFWNIFIKTCKENLQFLHQVSGRGTPNNFSMLFQKITD